jgi:hypothetical protein
MSDVYNIADAFAQRREKAVIDATAAIHDPERDPEKAGRAMRLSQLYGYPAEEIYPDVENFEKEAESSVSGDLVRDTPELYNYALSHPLAPHVSSDDWDNLYRAKAKIDQYHAASDSLSLPYEMYSAILHGGRQFASHLAEGVGGITPEQQKAWEDSVYQGLDPDKRKEMEDFIHGGVGSVLSGVGGMVGPGLAELGGKLVGIPPGMAFAALTGLAASSEAGMEAREKGVSFGTELGTRVAEGLGTAAIQYFAFKHLEGIMNMLPGAGSWAADKLAQAGVFGLGFSTIGEVQHAFDTLVARGTYDPDATYGSEHDAAVRIATNLMFGGIMGPMFGKAKSYIDAGKPPPHGLDPTSDKYIEDVSTNASQKFQDQFNELMAANTVQRSKELTGHFLDQWPDKEIRISPEALDRLYGPDEIPEPGDGKLGFIPNIAEQLEIARDTGSKVSVPLKLWLTEMRGDPELADALHDDLTVVHGGLSPNEVKIAREMRAAEPEPAIPPAKRAKMSVALPDEPGADFARGLDAVSAASGEKRQTFVLEEGFHEPADDTIVHPLTVDGNPVGNIHLISRPDGWVEIHDLYSHGGEWNIDYTGVKDLADQIYLSYPEAEGMLGFGNRIDFKRLMPDSIVSFMDEIGVRLRHGTWVTQPYEGYKAYILPKDLWLRHEEEMAAAIEEAVQRIAPTVSKTVITHGLVIPQRGSISNALYTWRRENAAQVLVSLGMEHTPFEYKHPVSLAWHEALHHLRTMNFFTEAEWGMLTRAARDLGWIEKYNIKKLYKDEPYDVILEEAIAHRFQDYHAEWTAERAKRDAAVVRGGWEATLVKLHDLALEIKARLSEIFVTQVPKWEDLFELAAEGKIGKRDLEGRRARIAEGQRQAVAEPKEGVEVPEIPKDIYQNPKYIGLTKARVKRLVDLQNKKNQSDADAIIGAAEKMEAREGKKQWKEWKDETTDEVTKDMNNRPDVAVDRFFSKGIMGGVKFKGLPKFQADALTPEQKAMLPEGYVAKEGLHPDDVAGMFGYQTGDSMIANLSAFIEARTTANMEPAPFLRRLINARVDQVMKERYGTLEDHINERAHDRVLSQTNLQMMGETIQAAAQQAGIDMTPADAKIIASQLRENFKESPVRLASVDKFMEAAMKASDEAAMVQRSGKVTAPVDAFQAFERRGHNMLLASLAKDVEKQQAFLKRFVKQYQKAEGLSTHQDYTNIIRWLLKASGAPIRSDMADIMREVDANGLYKSYYDLVRKREDLGFDMGMPSYMLDNKPPKPINQMTVDEFDEFTRALKLLKENGVMENKDIKDGDAQQLRKDVGTIVGDIKKVGEPTTREFDRSGARLKQVLNVLKLYGASGITVDSYANRIERGNRFGKLTSIVRNVLEARNNEDARIRSLRKQIQEIAPHWDRKYMDKKVDNPFFVDPLTKQPLAMRMRNLIAAAAGMSANRKKFLEGYGLQGKDQQVMDWLDSNMKKEDWQALQDINDKVWSPLFEDADTMHRNVNGGVGMKRVDPIPIQSKHGFFDGWYWPIKYDTKLPMLDPKSAPMKGDYDTLFADGQSGQGYNRATTSQGYSKARTGFIGPHLLTMDVLGLRIREMVHDIEMRGAIKDAAEVFFDKEFRHNLRGVMGENVEHQFVGWLQDAANSVVHDYQMSHAAMGLMELARQNLNNVLIGFNPNTAMKHGPTAFINSLSQAGVDKGKFAKYTMMMANPVTARNLMRTAREKSEEISRRWTGLGEIKGGIGMDVGIARNTWRDYLGTLGSRLVAASDMFSTIPMWHAAYDSAMEQVAGRAEYKNMTFDELDKVAAKLANEAVRRAHGSTSVVANPSIMRGSPAWQVYTSLFHFFNNMAQKHYQMAWQARDTYRGLKEWRDGGKTLGDALQWAPNLMWGAFAYVIWPAFIEEIITPMTDDEHESWGLKAMRTGAIGVSSSYVGIRDIVRAMFTNRMHDPQAGMVGTYLKGYADLVSDATKLVKEGELSEEQAGELIKHVVIAFGQATGYTNAQEGKWAEYWYRYIQGLEDPDVSWATMMTMSRGKTPKKGTLKSPVDKALELLGAGEE